MWKPISRFCNPSTKASRLHSERAQRRALLGKASKKQPGGETFTREASSQRHRAREQSPRADQHKQCAQAQARVVRAKVWLHRRRDGAALRRESTFARHSRVAGHERAQYQRRLDDRTRHGRWRIERLVLRWWRAQSARIVL